jgi:hypothetical protein
VDLTLTPIVHGKALIVMKSREMARILMKEGILPPAPGNPIKQESIRRKR